MQFRWTKEQEQFLIENYPDMDNTEIAIRLGLAYTQVRTKARFMKLHKSKESLQRQARKASKMRKTTKNEISLKNLIGQRDFKEEEIQDIKRRGGKSLKARYAQEKIRLCAGLQQETKLKITFASKAKRSFMRRLRNFGYEEVGKNIFRRPSSGCRPKTEKMGFKHNIRFVDYEES